MARNCHYLVLDRIGVLRTNNERRALLLFQLFAQLTEFVLDFLAGILCSQDHDLLNGTCGSFGAPDRINKVIIDGLEILAALLLDLVCELPCIR